MFSKNSYCESEVQEILQALFQEKKRAQALELQLMQSKLAPPVAPPPQATHQAELERQRALTQQAQEAAQKTSQEFQEALVLAEEEISSLKQQIHTLREQLTKPLAPQGPSQKETQMERVVHFLRQRNDELQLEIEELQKKILLHQEEIHRLSTERLSSEQEQQELRTELEALQSQLQTLRSSHVEMEEQLLPLQTARDAAQAEARAHHEAHQNSQRELELLRQMMMRTLQEFKEERLKEQEAYQNKVQSLTQDKELLLTKQSQTLLEKEELEHKLATQQSVLEQKQHILETQTATIEQQRLAYDALSLQTEEYQKKATVSDEARRHMQELLSQKEELIEGLNNQVARLARELADVEEALHQSEGEQQEQEARLRIAQQHLAKKVREATLLNERHDALATQLTEQETQLAEMGRQALEWQKLVETHEQRMKQAELHASKWEEKCTHLQERTIELESRCRELKKIEERMERFQQLFGQFNQLLSQAMPHMLPPAYEPEAIIPPTAPCITLQPSLFEGQKGSPSRYKESLFG